MTHAQGPDAKAAGMEKRSIPGTVGGGGGEGGDCAQRQGLRQGPSSCGLCTQLMLNK